MSLDQYDNVELMVAWTNRGHWFVTTMGLDGDGGHHIDPDRVVGHVEKGEYVEGVRDLEHESNLDAFMALADAILKAYCPSGFAYGASMKVIRLISEKVSVKALKCELIRGVVKAFTE